MTADDEDIPEVRCIKLTLAAVCASNTSLDRYSEWNSLIRTIGWQLRFSHNAKATKSTRLPKMYGPLTLTELAKPLTVWFQYVKSIEFKEELTALRKKKPVSSKSRPKSLNPFIDQGGLVLVCGRLSLSNLCDQRKFPIVLPPRHKITRMIFEHEHKHLLHAGPQALLASTHTRIWSLRGLDIGDLAISKEDNQLVIQLLFKIIFFFLFSYCVYARHTDGGHVAFFFVPVLTSCQAYYILLCCCGQLWLIVLLSCNYWFLYSIGLSFTSNRTISHLVSIGPAFCGLAEGLVWLHCNCLLYCCYVSLCVAT